LDAAISVSGGTDAGFGPHVGWSYGVVFTDANTADPISSSSILMGSKWFTNSSTLRTIACGIDLSGFSVTQALLRGANALLSESSLLLGANVSNVSEIKAGNNTSNANLDLVAKGTGGVRLKDGNGNTKIIATDVGVGFQGSSPLAKPSVSGSRGGNAALASLLTALASYGLITDATSA
jgi:hypothetical protein